MHVEGAWEGGSEMDHHTSWLKFLPGYGSLLEYFQRGGKNWIPSGGTITTVQHIYAGLIVAAILLVLATIARMSIADVDKAIVPPRRFGVVAFCELFLD